MSSEKIYNPFRKGFADKGDSFPSLLELGIDDFLEVIEKHLSNAVPKNESKWNLDDYPLLPGQAMYVMSYQDNARVSYQRGGKYLLGYADSEFRMELLLNYFHPDQYDLLQRIIKGAVNYGITQDLKQDKDTWMFLIFKARKKDGSYIPLIRQTSIYERDEKGRMLSSFSILSDLSGMNDGHKVEWRLKGPHVDEEKFRIYVHDAISGMFSEREMDVLIQLKAAFNSEQIAEKLFISKNTVDTHRRRMLKKSNCKNTTELLNFSRKNGLI